MSFPNPFLVQSGDFSYFILNFVPPPKVPIRILYIMMSIIVKSGMKNENYNNGYCRICSNVAGVVDQNRYVCKLLKINGTKITG